VIAILGSLRAEGWRPLRTIEFASWDAEEYNLIGSTEHVEDHIDELRKDGVAYLNVDVGVVGSKFRAAASPLFKNALERVLKRVSDPFKNETLHHLWMLRNAQVEGLGAGSDYVAFQDIAGTSSIDFGFDGEEENSFPYHSCYETFEWMQQFGDPGFGYHKLLAQVWVLLILEVSQELILPFDLNDYAKAITGYLDDLRTYAEKSGAPWAGEDGKGGFDIKPLYDANKIFMERANHFHEWEGWWMSQVYGRGGMETNGLSQMRKAYNDKMSHFETMLLDIPHSSMHGESDGEEHGVSGFFTALIKGGLGAKNKTNTDIPSSNEQIPGRQQFKHIIFGPQLWSGYEPGFFPFVRDAIEASNWTLAQIQVDKAAGILKRAAERL
jgi:N-acetylated-alpha-linked acidic dipeptidase